MTFYILSVFFDFRNINNKTLNRKKKKTTTIILYTKQWYINIMTWCMLRKVCSRLHTHKK